MVDYYIVAMSPLCIGSLLDFLVFLWVVSSVLIWLVVLMDAFPFLIFIFRVFLLLYQEITTPG
jgi:hypothetical protein